jgi:small subunit ribosomal protein S1
MSSPNTPESLISSESIASTAAEPVLTAPAAPIESPEAPRSIEPTAPDATPEEFKAMLKEYEQAHATYSDTGQKQINATVAALTADAALLDIGYKTEGILPLKAFTTPPNVGDPFIVTVKGRDEDGYYQLSLLKFAQPKDFSSLEEAFAAKGIISATVTAVVKGGLTVDVGARAFLPA